MLTQNLSEHGQEGLVNSKWERKLSSLRERERERELILCCILRNYGPTIRIQKVAESKGCNQVLWLFGEDHQVRPFQSR